TSSSTHYENTFFLLVLGSISFCKPRCSETIINSKTNTNGKADTIEAVCNASNPPEKSSTAAAADWTSPQINFTIYGGLNKPFVVCIPRTNVAESADVIKKVLIRIMAITVATILSGK